MCIIVQAVDVSEASSNAVKHAVALIKRNNGILIALYVIPPIDITDKEILINKVVLM